MANIIVAGSRTFNNYARLRMELKRIIGDDDTIISGGARGADTLAERYAEEYDHTFCCMLANWEEEGKFDRAAGYKRNVRMAEAGDILVAFWDGESKGTKHMIDIAMNKGLEVHVYRF